MDDYLNVDSPDAFKDMKKCKTVDYTYGEPVECPKCKGHGGWNLRIDAYGKGKHFQASCSQCNGWGYVPKGSKSESCIHKYKELSQDEAHNRGITHFGMCYHVYVCETCGNIMTQDSSD